MGLGCTPQPCTLSEDCLKAVCTHVWDHSTCSLNIDGDSLQRWPHRLPLLQVLLQTGTRNQLAECLGSVSVAPGNLNRAQLEEVLHDKCQEPRVHEAVCRTLLWRFSTSGMREWLLHLRRVGHNVEPSTSWGCFSKEIMVAAFWCRDGPTMAVPTSSAFPEPGQPRTAWRWHWCNLVLVSTLGCTPTRMTWGTFGTVLSVFQQGTQHVRTTCNARAYNREFACNVQGWLW